jgi:two-component system sensor histidine kinase KdpD
VTTLRFSGLPFAASRRAVDVLLALAVVLVSTGLGRLAAANPTAVGFLFLVAVLALAVSRGLTAAVLGSVAATLAYNWFFIPPLHTFTIAEPANWAALSSFLIVAVVASRLVVKAREKATEAEARQGELELLYDLSVDLFAATNRVGLLGEAAGRVVRSLGAKAGGLLAFPQGEARPSPISWSGEPFTPQEEKLARTVAERREGAEVPAEDGRRDAYIPLVVGGRTSGVLVLLGTAASRAVLEPAARLVALAVERERFLEESAHHEALRQSEALKTALLRAVSHDLRTPLTAMTLQIEALRRHAQDPGARRDLDGLAREATRLGRRIDNLLALARLEAGRSRPNPEPTPAADLFRAAREALPLLLDDHPVHVAVDRTCPDLFVDPSLALEVLVNLLENAARAAPEGTALELSAAPHPAGRDRVRLEIADRGPGLPPSPDDGGEAGPSDVARRGLGLEIARGLSSANGGDVTLLPRPGGGTIARMDFPAAAEPEET